MKLTEEQENKILEKIKNIACPYCNKLLTEKSFSNGRWQCEHCKKLLDWETFDKFYKRKK